MVVAAVGKQRARPVPGPTDDAGNRGDLVEHGQEFRRSATLRAVDALRPGGLLVAVPGRPAPPRVAEAAQAAEVRAPPFPVEPDGAGLATIAYPLANGAVEAEAAEVFDLEEVAKAREAAQAGQAGHARGKIVLRVRH
ncbi:zinc-binding dehydrogenase [Streptomyces solisilvae]|uniref:zinc-binding dehydrogenase n=1 Tax=Streptomyces malaysiensis TaxID=92644 RepID=UPI003320EC6B